MCVCEMGGRGGKTHYWVFAIKSWVALYSSSHCTWANEIGRTFQTRILTLSLCRRGEKRERERERRE